MLLRYIGHSTDQGVRLVPEPNPNRRLAPTILGSRDSTHCNLRTLPGLVPWQAGDVLKYLDGQFHEDVPPLVDFDPVQELRLSDVDHLLDRV